MNFSEDILLKLKIIVDEAYKMDEVPVGAVIFDKDMNIISYRHNERQSNGNVLDHAEVLAIVDAEKVIGDWRLNGYSMLVNLEPCTMCSSIIKESRLDKVYFFVEKPDLEHIIDIDSICLDGYDEYKVYFKSLLTDFFDNKR